MMELALEQGRNAILISHDNNEVHLTNWKFSFASSYWEQSRATFRRLRESVFQLELKPGQMPVPAINHGDTAHTDITHKL